VILEVNLHDLVRKTEHDSVAGSHPLLDIDNILDLSFWQLVRVDLRGLVNLWLFAAFQVATEML
jgi:hypothetical protein